MGNQTLGDIYSEDQAAKLTDRARAFTAADVENIFHGNPGAGVTVDDVKSMYSVATHRTNSHQPMFCFEQALNLSDGTANCHTCY